MTIQNNDHSINYNNNLFYLSVDCQDTIWWSRVSDKVCSKVYMAISLLFVCGFDLFIVLFFNYLLLMKWLSGFSDPSIHPSNHSSNHSFTHLGITFTICHLWDHHLYFFFLKIVSAHLFKFLSVTHEIWNILCWWYHIKS